MKTQFNVLRKSRELVLKELEGVKVDTIIAIGGGSTIDAAKALSIAFGKTNYKDVFYTEGNKEILFAIPFKNDDVNESQDFSFEMTAGGVRSGLNYLTDDFIAKMDPLDTERKAVLQNPANVSEVGKFISNSADARLCGNDWIVLRLADIHLLYVEAIMGGLSTTQNLDAIASYNAVRDRVGLSTLPVDGSGEITLEMLLNERRYELAFENHRFYDLVRTGQAQTVLSDFAWLQIENTLKLFCLILRLIQ